MNNKLVTGCLVLTLSSLSIASELVYTPVNPSFGGHPNNGPYLLSNAQSQNDHDDSSSSFTETSALERFTSSLQSQLLNDLLRDIGDGKTGTLETPDFSVTIENISGGGLRITTVDLKTGEENIMVVDGIDSGTP